MSAYTISVDLRPTLEELEAFLLRHGGGRLSGGRSRIEEQADLGRRMVQVLCGIAAIFEDDSGT